MSLRRRAASGDGCRTPAASTTSACSGRRATRLAQSSSVTPSPRYAADSLLLPRVAPLGLAHDVEPDSAPRDLRRHPQRWSTRLGGADERPPPPGRTDRGSGARRPRSHGDAVCMAARSRPPSNRPPQTDPAIPRPRRCTKSADTVPTIPLAGGQARCLGLDSVSHVSRNHVPGALRSAASTVGLEAAPPRLMLRTLGPSREELAVSRAALWSDGIQSAPATVRPAAGIGHLSSLVMDLFEPGHDLALGLSPRSRRAPGRNEVTIAAV